MPIVLWSTWSNVWELYHKVTFDGENKKIIINPDVDFISVKDDIYSAWKQWVKLLDNAKFEPAMRVIGGDPVGAGLFAGDIYFLINGWQMIIQERVAFNGVIYHDDPIDPFVVLPGGGVITTVSNLVQTASTSSSNVNVDAIATAVVEKIDSSSTSIMQIQTTLSEIETIVQNIEPFVDLTPILVELDAVKKKIDETQAFVLAS